MRQRLQSRRFKLRNFFAPKSIAITYMVLSLAAALTASQIIGSRDVQAAQSETPEVAVFRFHLPTEPQSLDPSKISSSDASYFFNNTMRGLYSFSNTEGLIAEGAESCRFETPLKLVCHLADRFWSDGSPVVAGDYVRSFQKLVSSAGKNPSVELLKNVKNVLAVNSGKIALDRLGVTANEPQHLTIEFEKPDPEFLYKLTASVLVPIKNTSFPKRGELAGLVFNGPYKIVSWTLAHRMRLEANPYYKRGNQHRPPVEILFVDDDQTALQLYEQKSLTLLRRLPTTYIATYRSRPDFLQIPVARFDYIGFGPELKDQPHLRAALSHSADFEQLRKIYDALGIPGCPSMPEELLDGPHCVKFDLKLAKSELEKVSPETRAKHYKLFFSKLGGDDIKKGMEWFQAQWKNNLGLQIELEQMEQGTYLNQLRQSPPAIFRKGLALERPTCLAALETFAAGGSENFLNLNDPIFESLLKSLQEASHGPSATKSDSATKVVPHTSVAERKLCGEGVEIFLKSSLLIPLGRIHFTLLADPRFTGWSLNEMNQLDLAGLSHAD